MFVVVVVVVIVVRFGWGWSIYTHIRTVRRPRGDWISEHSLFVGTLSEREREQGREEERITVAWEMFAFFSSSVEQNCLQLISFSFFIFYYTFLRFEKRTAPRECVCLFTRIIWKCFCGEAVDIKWIENGREGWGGESWINKSTVDDTFSSLSESSSSRWRHCWSNYRNIDKLSARSVIHAIIPFPFFYFIV